MKLSFKTLLTWIVLTVFCDDVYAQINMTIDESAFVSNRVDAVPFPMRVFTSHNAPDIKVKPLTASLNDGSKSFPVSRIGIIKTSIPVSGSNTSTEEIHLISGTEVYSTYTSNGNRFSGWFDDRRFYPKLFVKDLKSSAWMKGVYSTSLNFRQVIKNDGKTDPASATLTVTVEPLMKIINNNLSAVTLAIDKLEYFRNGYKSAIPAAQSEFSVRHTVPFGVSIVSSGIGFLYTGTGSKNNPVSFVSAIWYELNTGEGFGPSRQISSNGSRPIEVNVPVGNTSNATLNYLISASDLRTNFKWEGSYETRNGLEFLMQETISDGTVGLLSKTTLPSLKVVVSDMKDFLLKDSQVDFSFKTTADYNSGLTRNMPAHLRTSATKPFNLTVKAETATFLLDGKASTLPCSILEIGPVDGDVSLNRISLSTKDQILLNAAQPQIDTDIDVQYKIPSNPLLVPAKKEGTYSLKVTYSMSAL